jgi:hypothetical protein
VRVASECVGATYCKIGSECPGKCSALEAEGAHCRNDGDCESSLTCEGQTCTRPTGEGDDCGGNVAPDCGLGLVCVGADSDSHTTGTCEAPEDVLSEPEGGACDVFRGPYCQEGLSCVVDEVDAGTGAITFTCVAPSSAGGDCSSGFPDPCPDDQACDADPTAGDFDGTCQPLPTAGEPCLGGAGPSCAPDLACAGQVCVVVHRIGETCSENDGCYSGRCEEGHCQAPDACDPG